MEVTSHLNKIVLEYVVFVVMECYFRMWLKSLHWKVYQLGGKLKSRLRSAAMTIRKIWYAISFNV